MQIIITEKALDWFKQEMEAEPGNTIRFFARYGGSSQLHEGFSLGVTKDVPDEAAVEAEYEGISFFIEERDLWYFDGHDLHVSINSENNELDYAYKKE